MSELRIAVATTNFGYAFQASTLKRIKEHVKAGQTVVQCATDGVAERAQTRLLKLLEQKPAALIGICIRPDPAVIQAYAAARVPVVLIDEETDGASTVTSDNFQAGRMAADYLLGKGRKRLAVVAGKMNVDGGYNALQRVNGARKALADRGMALPEGCLIEVSQYSHKNGADAIAQLLAERRNVDAIFCAAGDNCASGLLSAAGERGVKVPQALAVVGYDDLPLAAIATPPLTTIQQPLDQIAAAAFELATSGAAEILAKPKKIYFEPKLVVRESA